MALKYDIHEQRAINAPTGVAIKTRLRLTDHENTVISELVDHLSSLRRKDLAERSRLAKNHTPQDFARRKRELTSESTSRWAGSITRTNNDQYAFARRGQLMNIQGTRAAIRAIEARLAVPCGQKPQTVDGAKQARGYKNQHEHAMKRSRLQALKSRLSALEADYANGIVHVVDGGKHRLKKRANTQNVEQWRTEWDAERAWIRANGSKGELFGNQTFPIAPDGTVSIRLPEPLVHLANSRNGRFALAAPVKFSYRANEWVDQVSAGKAVAYTLAKSSKNGGWYLTASWTQDVKELPEIVHKRTLGIDLNADHIAGWVLDEAGNPLGAHITIPFVMEGSTSLRDARLRHAITKLLRVARQRKVTHIVIEDLGFEDARTTGRETMGRGKKAKTFRATVSGMPTAKFRGRLQAMCARAGVTLTAVNPAYTSQWGQEHWKKPLSVSVREKNVTRHHSAAVVIGRRGLSLSARRRKGVSVLAQRSMEQRATFQAERGTQNAKMRKLVGSRARIESRSGPA